MVVNTIINPGRICCITVTVVNTITKKPRHKRHYLLGASKMKVTTLYGIKQAHSARFCHCGFVCVTPNMTEHSF